MDTLTHAVLGGSIAYLVAGKTSPKKALLWGAAYSVIPDIDVFAPHASDLAAMTWHRSWSHSWLMQTLAAPFFAAAMHRFDKTFNFKTWWLVIWLALLAHSGLDALTVYGTQLFWPFTPPPVSIGSIFIIDPVFTIPLLIGFLWMWRHPYQYKSRRILVGCLSFSAAYLIWGLAAQTWISHDLVRDLKQRGIADNKVQVTAAPFTTLLWRVLVIDGDNYYEGFHSVFDHANNFDLRRYSRHIELASELKKQPNYQRFRWFNNGYFKLERQGNQIIATDLRMGLEPIYFFRFKLADVNQSGHWVATIPNRVHSARHTLHGVEWVWRRIWQPNIYFKIDAAGT